MASHGHVEYSLWLNVEPIQLRVLLCRCKLIVKQFGVYSNNRLPSFTGSSLFPFCSHFGIFLLLFCGLNWILKNGLSCFRALFGWERECSAWKMPILFFYWFYHASEVHRIPELHFIRISWCVLDVRAVSALFESLLRIYILKVLFIR